MCESPQKRNLNHVGRWSVKFGKYADLTFDEVIEKDRDYAIWLKSIVKSLKVRAYLSERLGI